MSAPRKFWANVDFYDTFSGKGLCGDWNHCDVGSADDTVYHHDDVVRELVEAAEEACGDFREWLAGAIPGCCVVPESLLRLEAALAKIAQEG